MSTNDFFKLYKRPEWQKKRLEIMKRDDFRCIKCGEYEKELHVHHKMYLKDTNPWEYANYFYQTLCKDCHKKEEIMRESAITEFWSNYYKSGLGNNDIDILINIIQLLNMRRKKQNSLKSVLNDLFETLIKCYNG